LVLVTYHANSRRPQFISLETALGSPFRVQSVVEIGHGHAGLGVKRAQALVCRADVRETAIHHTAERVLEGLLLESVLLEGFSRRSGFGDSALETTKKQ
jgi:hypothetical protein